MYVKETSFVVGKRPSDNSWYSIQNMSRFRVATRIFGGLATTSRWATV